MNSGDLTSAMRASMSAPGVFSPVERDGRLLVDGGICGKLPIDVARAMGVDILIVVDVGTPLLKRDRLSSAPVISNQMLAILIQHNSRAAAGEADAAGRADRAGAGRNLRVRFRDRQARDRDRRDCRPCGCNRGSRRLSVSPQEYAAYVAQREMRAGSRRHASNSSRWTKARGAIQPVGSLFKDVIGKPLDPDAVARARDDDLRPGESRGTRLSGHAGRTTATACCWPRGATPGDPTTCASD